MESISRDIVIAGGGAAGLAAAISAAEKGAQVTVLEKRDRIGGISVTGMGIFAVESHLQKLKNHMLTREDAFHYFMDCTHWHADAKLVAKFINRSAQTVEWLEDMGVRFQLLDINWGEHGINQTAHVVCTPDGLKLRGGVTTHMINAMLKRAEELGVKIRTKTELDDLVKEDGKITHLIAKTQDGERIDYRVKAAIIASGGYVHNQKLLQERNGRKLNKDYFLMHNIVMDGKGIEKAWEAGAGCDGMTLQQGGFMSGINYQMYPDVKRVPHSNWLTGVAECPVLYVNLHGKRFMDEGLFNKTYKGYQIERQKDKIAYALLDSDWVDYIAREGVMDVGYMNRETAAIPFVKEVLDQNAELNTPYVISADTIEELAEKCGIDPDTLVKTVDEYNAACDIGWDKEFGKKRRWLMPVCNGKFYALQIRLEGYGTVGGIRINSDCEVTTDNDDVIPGLYAAGDCANNAVTWDYSIVYKLWGCTLGLAVNTGRFAGESAADYVKSL